MMNKKGQGLPINTVVIAILVIIVLVIVVVFFLGGFAGLATKIKSVFFPVIQGTDIQIAAETCKTRCEQATALPGDTLKSTSAYCKGAFNIDTNGDGEAEYIDASDKSQGYKSFYCHSPEVNIRCPGVDNLCKTETGSSGTAIEKS